MQSVSGYFSIFGIGIALTIFWVLALFWIWQDADETYGYGWFWALMMFIFPIATLVVYLITKRLTHRTVDQDLQAWEDRNSNQSWGWRSESDQEQEDLSRPLSSGGKFKPYKAGFSDSIEEYLRKTSDGTRQENDW